MKRIQYKLRLDKYARWRKQAEAVSLSKEGKDRLEWMIQIDKGMTVSDIAKEYNIGKSLIYKWKKIFYEHFMQSLETRSKKPHNIRIGKENTKNIHTDNGKCERFNRTPTRRIASSCGI